MLNPLRRLLILMLITYAMMLWAVRPALALSAWATPVQAGQNFISSAPLPLRSPAPLLASLAITATKIYTLSTDTDGDNQADPGDVLSYTIVITNDGGTTATGLTLSDTLDANLGQLGLASVSPVAFDDSYNTSINPVTLNVADGASDLFFADYPGLNPAVSGISSFGGGSLGGAVTDHAAGSTVIISTNGSLTANANGSFNFTPAVGFQGVFTFFYRLQNFVGPADGLVSLTVDAPPTVTTTSPINGATGVNGASNITINFSENVAIAAGGITLGCPGAVSFSSTPALPASGINSITLDPTTNLPGLATCTVTVLAANTTDSDANDPPNQLDGNNNGIEGDNYSFTFDVAPTANDDSFNVTPHLTLNSASSVRANDDPTSVTITGFGNTLGTANGTVPNGTNFVTAGGAGGRVVLNADGTFSYFPDAGDTNTSATFFYTITGGDTATVTLTLQNTELVWFVDNTPSATVCTGTNSGTQACPEDLLADVAAVDTSGDTIFVAAGSYTCGITLAASERLLGDGSSSDLQTLTGITPVTGSSFPPFSGADPTLNSGNADCLTLAASNTIRGLTINANSATLLDAGILGSGVGGTTSVNEVTINTSSNGNGVILTNQSGTFTFSDGSITGGNAAGAVGIDQGTAAITFTNTTINKTGGGLIGVTNKTGGSVNFSGGSITGTSLNPALLSGVILLQNNTSTTINFGNGFNISTSSGGGFFASSGGTVTIGGTSSAISASGGPALNVTGTTFSGGVTFATVLSTNSGTNGVNLNNVTGTLTMNGGSISGSAGTAFNVSGGNATITYAGNITQNNTQRVVNVDGTTGGAVSFTTGTMTGGASSTGININNANGNVNFANLTLGTSGSRMTNQAVTITGGTGTYTLGTISIFTNNAQGIVATNADGTLNSTSGTVNTTNNRAINIDGPAGLTTLGMTLTSVSSTNSTNNGILIQDTNGSFTVSGSGGSCTLATPTCTGGLIANTTGANDASVTPIGTGVVLNNVTNISFTNVRIRDHTNYGIRGNNVTGFTLNTSVVDATAPGFNGDDPANEDGSIYITNLLGTSNIADSDISRGLENIIQIDNTSGTGTLNITNSKIHDTSLSLAPLVGNAGIHLIAQQTAALTVNITNSDVRNVLSDCILGRGRDNGTLNLTATGNTLLDSDEAFDLAVDQNADMTYDIQNNAMTGHTQNTLQVTIGEVSNLSSVSGKIIGNTFGSALVVESGSELGFGINIDLRGNGTSATTIHNNTISHTDREGILFAVRGESSSAIKTGNHQMRITNNTINAPDDNSAFPFFDINGIEMETNNGQTFCLNMSGNESRGAGNCSSPTCDSYRLRQRNQGAASVFRIQGLTPASGATAAQVEAYVEGQNPGTVAPADTATVQTSGSSTIVNYTAATCTTPAP